MKRFYYTTERKYSRTYGGANVTAQVFVIRKGELKRATEAKWCTRSYPGEETSVMRALAAAGAIPKKWNNGQYYSRDNGKFTITAL